MIHLHHNFIVDKIETGDIYHCNLRIFIISDNAEQAHRSGSTLAE